MLKKWNELPKKMRTKEVYHYYRILQKKQGSLFVKRIFDLCMATLLLVIASPVFLVISLLITIDSPGGVLYRQTRVTTYGKEFQIHKFRTMVANADRTGLQLTVGNDARITKIGAFLRRYRLDELPQLIDILQGNMSFVGTRPEVPKYVEKYTKEMMATLLLPAGITSEASVRFKEEAELLVGVEDVDQVYIQDILPRKMDYNLKAIETFSFFQEIITMFRTVFAVLGKDYDERITKEKSTHRVAHK